jgi:hypothetical protein
MISFVLKISNHFENTKKFITALRHTVELNGNAFIDVDDQFIHDVLYGKYSHVLGDDVKE